MVRRTYPNHTKPALTFYSLYIGHFMSDTSNLMNDSPKSDFPNRVIKFSTCLPAGLYLQLAKALSRPFSTAPEGTMERGAMAEWIRESALITIGNHSRIQSMENFLESRGLLDEYRFHAASESLGLKELL